MIQKRSEQSRYTFRLSIDQGDMPVIDVVVGANDNEGEVAKAKKAIQRLLNDFTPSFRKPVPAAPEIDQEDHVSTEQTAPPEPPSAPAKEKKPEGVKGRVRLYCPECGSTFGTFLKERQSDITCKCGHLIDLTIPLAKYHFSCPYCKKETWGLTNLEDPSISIKCKCGCIVDMQWDPKAKEYRN